jgi:quercetin dioxygenase-like cupin family protein
MKSMKWAVLLAVGAAMGFAGGVYAGAAKKEMVVTPAADVKWAPLDPKDTEGKGPQMSVLFGDPKKKGSPLGVLMHFPAGFTPGPHTHSSDDYAVVIKGTQHNFAGDDKGPGVGPGSTWYQPGKQVHNNECEAGSDCVLFVYTPNGFDFQPAPAKDMAKPAK